jgi:hypothetical protein
MRGVLLLAVLTVRSSYSRNVEICLEDPEGVPDTLQWWFGSSGCWRIRTYAIDHDIHVFQIGNSPQTTLEMAKRNNLKNYGDLINVQHAIHFVDCANRLEREAEFGRVGLAPRLEIDNERARFVFWKPDDEVYSTKSAPGQEKPNRAFRKGPAPEGRL